MDCKYCANFKQKEKVDKHKRSVVDIAKILGKTFTSYSPYYHLSVASDIVNYINEHCNEYFEVKNPEADWMFIVKPKE